MILLFLIGAVFADDLSLRCNYVSKENWKVHIKYYSPDVSMEWYREASKELNFGYRYVNSKKIGNIEGQVTAVYDRLKGIDSQELSLMGCIKDFRVGCGVSMLKLRKPRLVVKVKYTKHWNMFFWTSEFSSNFKDRHSIFVEPRISIPAWKFMSIEVGCKYLRSNGRVRKEAYLGGLFKVERNNDQTN